MVTKLPNVLLPGKNSEMLLKVEFKGSMVTKLPGYLPGQVHGDLTKTGFEGPRRTELPEYWLERVVGDVS
jgi:hypothetical protein